MVIFHKPVESMWLYKYIKYSPDCCRTISLLFPERITRIDLKGKPDVRIDR